LNEFSYPRKVEYPPLPHSVKQGNEVESEKREASLHAHYGLIKLIVMDALKGLQNPMTWVDFLDMDRDAFLESQAKAQWELEGATTKGKSEKEEVEGEEEVFKGKLEEEVKGK